MPVARRSTNRTVSEVVGELELVITRTIDGPARIVFDCWTKAELMTRWWAPKAIGVPGEGFTSDLRVGGKYRQVLRTHGGPEIAFSGTYLEVEPPKRLRYTTIFEPRPEAGEVLCTVTFEEHAGKTNIRLHEKFPSRETLDAALCGGMDASLEQLDELVASLG